MKKLIIVTLVTTCVALCAAVWPRGNAVEETPVASELQPSTGQALAKNSAPEPTPPQPPKELQPGDILGHTNASFTLDTYTHVTSDMQKQACGIVGGFMEDIFGKELKPWQESEKPATER